MIFNTLSHEVASILLPPANVVCEGYVLHLSVILLTGGRAWLLWGVEGHAWLLRGDRDVHGCSGGHAWLLWGGMHGCSGGCVLLLLGVCFFPGGHAWFFGGACIGYDEIRSLSGQYASFWNTFLFRFTKCLYWGSHWQPLITLIMLYIFQGPSWSCKIRTETKVINQIVKDTATGSSLFETLNALTWSGLGL